MEKKPSTPKHNASILNGKVLLVGIFILFVFMAIIPVVGMWISLLLTFILLGYLVSGRAYKKLCQIFHINSTRKLRNKLLSLGLLVLVFHIGVFSFAFYMTNSLYRENISQIHETIQQGNWKAASKHLQELRNEFPYKTEKDDTILQLANRIATIALKNSDYKKAKKNFSLLVTRAPNDKNYENNLQLCNIALQAETREKLIQDTRSLINREKYEKSGNKAEKICEHLLTLSKKMSNISGKTIHSEHYKDIQRKIKNQLQTLSRMLQKVGLHYKNKIEDESDDLTMEEKFRGWEKAREYLELASKYKPSKDKGSTVPEEVSRQYRKARDKFQAEKLLKESRTILSEVKKRIGNDGNFDQTEKVLSKVKGKLKEVQSLAPDLDGLDTVLGYWREIKTLAQEQKKQGKNPKVIVTRSGQKYKVEKIIDVKPDAITIQHTSGISKLNFSELSKNIREKYDYDPTKAKQYAKKVAKSNRLHQSSSASQSDKNESFPIRRVSQYIPAESKLRGFQKTNSRPADDTTLKAWGATKGWLSMWSAQKTSFNVAYCDLEINIFRFESQQQALKELKSEYNKKMGDITTKSLSGLPVMIIKEKHGATVDIFLGGHQGKAIIEIHLSQGWVNRRPGNAENFLLNKAETVLKSVVDEVKRE